MIARYYFLKKFKVKIQGKNSRWTSFESSPVSVKNQVQRLPDSDLES